MHILVIGGTGRVGQLVISTALSQNHTVTALVRNPSSSSSSLPPRPGLTIITGSPLSIPSIRTAITSSPVPSTGIIVTLASVRTSDSPFAKPISPPRFMADVHRNLVQVMREFDGGPIRRIVTLSAFGVGDSNAQVWWPMRMVMNHSGLRVAFADHGLLEGEMRGEMERRGVEWVGVRAAMMIDDGDGDEGMEKEVRIWGETGKGSGLWPSVTRGSVARFLVECVDGRREEWVGKTPVISN